MSDKNEGAPQETIKEVMVEMLCDAEGSTAQTSDWMRACRHYHDRLSRAVKPTFPELRITTIPNDGIVVAVPEESITRQQAHDLRAAIFDAKKVSGSSAVFLVLQSGMTLEILSDEDLARLGLQRIPA